jgi:hypothetical protein
MTSAADGAFEAPSDGSVFECVPGIGISFTIILVGDIGDRIITRPDRDSTSGAGTAICDRQQFYRNSPLRFAII